MQYDRIELIVFWAIITFIIIIITQHYQPYISIVGLSVVIAAAAGLSISASKRICHYRNCMFGMNVASYGLLFIF